MRELQRNFEARHRARRLDKNRRWLRDHPDWNRDKSSRRRAAERGNAAEKIDRQAIFDRDGGRCHICRGHVARNTFTLDHLIPIADGGPHTRENVAVAHRSCNLRRGRGRIPAQLRLVG